MEIDHSNDRHDRVASLIKEIAADFIQREANHDPMITVTRVSIAPDYRRATIFFTTIPEERQQDALIFLKRSAGDFRQYLKKKCKLKLLPHLEFDLDVGERHRQHIDEIARTIESEAKQKTDQ